MQYTNIPNKNILLLKPKQILVLGITVLGNT